MSRRTTVALGVAALVLTAAGGAEAWYVWGTPTADPTAERPVVVGDVDAQAAVDVAATDAAAIFSTSWRRYDAHLREVTSLMTPDMATRYLATAAPVRARVVQSRTDTATRVAASGVVRATADRVLALLFLDQRSSTRGEPPAYAARRALVTLVRSDQGWLVDNVQTR